MSEHYSIGSLNNASVLWKPALITQTASRPGLTGGDHSVPESIWKHQYCSEQNLCLIILHGIVGWTLPLGISVWYLELSYWLTQCGNDLQLPLPPPAGWSTFYFILVHFLVKWASHRSWGILRFIADSLSTLLFKSWKHKARKVSTHRSGVAFSLLVIHTAF